MKAFLDYTCQIINEEPIELKQRDSAITIFVGDIYLGSLWGSQNYFITRKEHIKYKIIGKYWSLFSFPTIYKKLLRYRFI